MKLKVK